MKNVIKDIYSELKLVLTGKSLDILVPPVLFLILNNLWSLLAAMIGAIVLGLGFLMKRIKDKESVLYAIGGLMGTIFAIFMVYVNRNASNFFLPDLISTFTLILVSLVSLLIKKPLAIWVSHITRGWELQWFYRKDIYPAYKEVTIFWLIFFISRFFIELYFYINTDVNTLAFFNVIIGLPVLIGVLTISYIYGISRLKRLGGPGIDEFRNQTPPPWKGQRKGF